MKFETLERKPRLEPQAVYACNDHHREGHAREVVEQINGTRIAVVRSDTVQIQRGNACGNYLLKNTEFEESKL